MRRTAPFPLAILLVLLAALLQAQGTPPSTPLTLVSREGRRPVPTTIVNDQELIALDEVAALFKVAVREDTLAGGVTVSFGGRTVVLSTEQPMASVSGRLITLPSRPIRSGGRWFVPVEFLSRALAPIYNTRIELRRPSRLLLVGDVRVPRVTARVDAAGPPTRATIEIVPATPATVTTEGRRVVVRVDADALDLGLPADGAGLIDGIRAGEQPTMVAVVLDERAGAARYVPSDAGGVTRIAVEVAAADSAAVPAPAAPAAPPAETAVPLTLTRSVLQAIVVDPGHGGDDPGVRGANGTEEKRITLQVARRLKSLIELRLGVRVILTREDDVTLSLDDRAALANNSKADLFLSLHLNAAPVASMSGAQVYHVRLDREGEDARRAAETDVIALPVLGGATRIIDVIRWDLAQARHVDASSALAAMLEEDLRGHIRMAPRPRQPAPLRVLTGVDMPAALIEMAYLTNRDQEGQARSEAFQTAVVQGIYNAVVRFRGYLEEQRTP